MPGQEGLCGGSVGLIPSGLSATLPLFCRWLAETSFRFAVSHELTANGTSTDCGVANRLNYFARPV
jgi:hypothetical protein